MSITYTHWKRSHTKILFVIAVTATLAFIVLAIMVSQKRLPPGDVAILQLIHRDIPASMSRTFLTATEIGGPVGIVAIVVLIAGLMAYGRRYSNAIIIVLSVAIATVVNLGIKELFKRTRPTLWDSITHAQNFSFPSGHAMASSALAFAMCYITWHTRWRWITIIVGSIFMVMVGLSRLYFGVHYPSDILGGWIASTVVVACVIYCKNSFFERHKTGATAPCEK